jgi:hypothetical protein
MRASLASQMLPIEDGESGSAIYQQKVEVFTGGSEA